MSISTRNTLSDEMSTNDSEDIELIQCGKMVIRVIGNNIKCCCCYDKISINDILDCNHCLCSECVKSLNENACPMCRSSLSGKNITNEVLFDITMRKKGEIARNRVKNKLIIILSQRISILMYDKYRLNANIMFDSSIQVLYNTNPSDWVKNITMFNKDCNNMRDSIIEDYPHMDKVPNLYNDVISSYEFVFKIAL